MRYVLRVATRIVKVAVVASCCVAIAACGGKEASQDAGRPTLEKEGVAYFRHSDDQSVYRVSKTRYCLVANPAQMESFGGFDQVKVVTPGFDFKRGKKAVEGLRCPSP